MTATALWASVVAAYESSGLVRLTNIRDRSATTVDTTVGESAAQEVIDLWPIYAEEVFDATNTTAMAIARHGVIAVLWRRGGSSQEIAKVEWDYVFGSSGMVESYKMGQHRARSRPSSNSGVRQAQEGQGRRIRGWSDRASLPPHYLPRDIVAND